MAAKTSSEAVQEKSVEMSTSGDSDKQPPMDESKPNQPKGAQSEKTTIGVIEENFLGRFMSPMMAQMEERVKRNTEMLDEIQREMDKERDERMKKRASEHIPDTIKEYGQELPDIMKTLEHLILYENYEKEEDDESKYVKARLKKMDTNSEVAVLSHSISAYVSTLEPSHLKHLANRVVSDTTKWLSGLFRMDNSSAYFHEEEKDGLVKICKLAIHKKYPQYINDGYEALHSSPPVIYISAASRPGLGQYLCTQLGLPSSSICTVPLYKNTNKMDLDALVRLYEGDEEGGKTPVMVVAYAGTPVVGHVDDIGMLRDFCRKKELWLHIEGNNIALLTYFTVPTDIRPVTSGDSLALNLGGWLGIPAVPYITLYKTPEEAAHARAAGLTYFNAKYKLNCMPLWISLQNIGHYGIFEKIKFSVSLAKEVHDKIGKIDTIRNVTFFELENPTVVFRYVHPNQNPDFKEREAKRKAEEKKAVEREQKLNPKKKVDKNENEEKENETTEEEEEEEKPFERNPYFDALNIWLCETLKRDCPKVHIAAIEIANEGVCIRFAPMESIHDYNTTEEELETFLACLDRQLSILDATVRHRQSFAEIVEAQDNLRLVNLTNWAGLGAVQYIPTSQLPNLDNLSELGVSEFNKINYELVQQLKSADTAFSLGQSSERMFCVRFGLVTEDTDLEELIGLVYSTGKEVEESTTFLESMAENIRKGIEKAQEDLVKENQEKLAQEGALRQIPLVGSLMNWWSPPPKEGVKGRTFNLASGKIASTEETYRYKMQIQEAEEAAALNSPKPRTGSYKASLQPVGSQSVSRQVSGASNTSSPSSPSYINVNHSSGTDSVINNQQEEAPSSPTPDNPAVETEPSTEQSQKQTANNIQQSATTTEKTQSSDEIQLD